MTEIEKLLAALAAERDDCYHRARDAQEEADQQTLAGDMLASRIKGVEEARALLGPEPSNEVDTPQRRNIRALVKAAVDVTGNRDPAAIAVRIGCRKSQVVAALDYLASQEASSNPSYDELGLGKGPHDPLSERRYVQQLPEATGSVDPNDLAKVGSALAWRGD